MNIKKITIQDVRCFGGEQEFNICPVTFIVGENSTGKSTALGCLQIINNFLVNGKLDFNIEPYLMGAFPDIVRRSSPVKKEFKLGIEYEDTGVKYFLTLAERDRGSEPIIQEQRIIFRSDNEIVIVKKKRENSSEKHFPFYKYLQIKSIEEKQGGKKRFIIEGDMEFVENRPPFFYLGQYLFRKPEGMSADEKKLAKLIKKESLVDIASHFFRPSFCSFAPIRSKPKRTYNPLREEFTPEGDEMPVVLMNMSRTKGKEWDELKKQLDEFGKSSGLFQGVDIRTLGKSKGDPFQIQIKVRGPRVNLMDVGYGISQILPILIRIFNTMRETTFLMQQPEVHLHPKGQAELSSLLIRLAEKRKHNFIIETHSDYMIDRARIEIMQKKVKPEDVSLIYLEPLDRGNRVRVHNIRFDKEANLLGAPENYRKFFLRETDSLMGFSDG